MEGFDTELDLSYSTRIRLASVGQVFGCELFSLAGADPADHPFANNEKVRVSEVWV